MKIGVEIKIDVTKIDKARIFTGQKGKYLTMTTFIDIDNQDQYGNNGMVTHKKDQNENQTPILGNSKVFWSDANNQQQSQQQGGQQRSAQQATQQSQQPVNQQRPMEQQNQNTDYTQDPEYDDSIPF